MDIGGNTFGCGTGVVVGEVGCTILEDGTGDVGVTLGDVAVGDGKGAVSREKMSLRVLMA